MTNGQWEKNSREDARKKMKRAIRQLERGGQAAAGAYDLRLACTRYLDG